ncbi:MAG: alanine--glyoxylate aminotransferase family protein [Armatimonadetes bacterium]|nr:alanine--glyoxylate aminotransferase family protein [Armatimonadota bacterium]
MPDTWISPERVLMGPGPSNIHPRVLRAMAQQTIGHLDPHFLVLMDRVGEGLRHLFQTRNPVTLAISGTGMSGMEACLVNLVEPGDRVVVGVHGYFGERLVDLAARVGGEVTRVEVEWGRALDPAALIDAVRRVRPALVACVHAETSTGVLQPVEEIAAAAREAGALMLLDTVTSLGGVEVRIDDWGVDAAYSGTQKCVGCPSGLAPVTFSERAMERVRRRSTRVPSFYFDLALLSQYWGTERIYHHTAPANMLFGLNEALDMIAAEGLEVRYARHQRNARALRAGLQAMGLRLFADEAYWLPSLTTVCIPEGVNDLPVRQALLRDWNLEIGGGLGPVRGRVWRIGLMGHTSSPANVLYALHGLHSVLAGLGVSLPDGLAAAAQALEASA